MQQKEKLIHWFADLSDEGKVWILTMMEEYLRLMVKMDIAQCCRNTKKSMVLVEIPNRSLRIYCDKFGNQWDFYVEHETASYYTRALEWSQGQVLFELSCKHETAIVGVMWSMQRGKASDEATTTTACVGVSTSAAGLTGTPECKVEDVTNR